MGASSGGNIAEVERTVTPAVARTVDEDTAKAQAEQEEARAKRSGIRSTYTRFATASQDATAGKNGSAAKLG